MTTANATSNHGLLLTHTEDNSANIANLVVGSTTAAANQSDITVNNAETVNITSQGAANTVTDLQATDMVTLNITAGKGLILDADSTGTYSVLTTIDASASTAAVNFAGTSGSQTAHAAQIMKMVGRIVLFDSSTPQGLTHIHMTALMWCVRCAARLQHMVAHRACRDIAAEILHSALSMRSRLRTAPGGQNLNGGSRPCK